MSQEGRRLIDRWASWVAELEDHPLDQYEYAGALELRDRLEVWLNVSGDQVAVNAVAEIDARFDDVTCEDDRFAIHFREEAGTGWWWLRMPSDPQAQDYITQNWTSVRRPPGAPG